MRHGARKPTQPAVSAEPFCSCGSLKPLTSGRAFTEVLPSIFPPCTTLGESATLFFGTFAAAREKTTKVLRARSSIFWAFRTQVLFFLVSDTVGSFLKFPTHRSAVHAGMAVPSLPKGAAGDVPEFLFTSGSRHCKCRFAISVPIKKRFVTQQSERVFWGPRNPHQSYREHACGLIDRATTNALSVKSSWNHTGQFFVIHHWAITHSSLGDSS